MANARDYVSSSLLSVSGDKKTIDIYSFFLDLLTKGRIRCRHVVILDGYPSCGKTTLLSALKIKRCEHMEIESQEVAGKMLQNRQKDDAKKSIVFGLCDYFFSSLFLGNFVDTIIFDRAFDSNLMFKNEEFQSREEQMVAEKEEQKIVELLWKKITETTHVLRIIVDDNKTMKQDMQPKYRNQDGDESWNGICNIRKIERICSDRNYESMVLNGSFDFIMKTVSTFIECKKCPNKS